METIKDIIRIEELKGRESLETLVEIENYVNPSKPSIGKVLWVDGQMEVLSTKLISDRLVVLGVVKLKLVYRSEEMEGIFYLDINQDLKEEIVIPGTKEDMGATVKAKIDYIEYELKDERKILIRALVSLEGKVRGVNSLEIIKDIEDKENLEILEETIRYKEILARETSYAIIKENIEVDEDLPAIEEILKISFKAFEGESTVADNRIIISGSINGRIVYLGQGEIKSLEEEIPFSHFLDIEGAMEGAHPDLAIEVVEGRFEILENYEGQLKVLDLEIKLRVSGAVYLENEKSLIVDAYSTREKINIEMDNIKLVENINNSLYRENVRGDLSDYKIGEIYDISGNPRLLDYKALDDGLTVEGSLGVQAIYLEEDGENIGNLVKEIPYKFYLPIEGLNPKSRVEIDMDLETIKADKNSNIYSLEAAIKHRISINKDRVLKVIKSIEKTGEIIDKRNRPSIIIYMVQKDTNLWDIAKRYNTTIEELLEDNENINLNSIMPGEKIIIEKKIDVKL